MRSSRVYATVGRLSVRLCVRPVRSPHAASVGLLLWARPAGDVDRSLHGNEYGKTLPFTF